MAIDTKKIKDNVLLSEVIGRRIELKKNGSEFSGCCPFHEEKTPSFSVSDVKNFYYCFGCGAGGDAMDFIMNFERVDFKEACRILGGDDVPTGTAPEKRAAIQREDIYERYSPRSILLADLQEFKCEPKADKFIKVINPKRDHEVKNWRPSMVFPYMLPNNIVYGYVLRLEMGDGKKITPAIRHCQIKNGSPALVAHPFDEKMRPLYRLPELIESKGQVIVVEGEKTADHLAKTTGLVVVTWSGGSNAVARTDWGQLKGRSVIIVPDNDLGGLKAARDIQAELVDVDASSIKIAIPEADKPKGWDVADQDWDKPSFIKWAKSRIGTLNQQVLNDWCDAHGQEYIDEITRKPIKDEPESAPAPAIEKEDPQNYDDHFVGDNPLEVDNVVDFPNATQPVDIDWKAELMFKDKEGLKLESNVFNAQHMLSYHEDMEGVLGFNKFSHSVDIIKQPPWETEQVKYPRSLNDVDDTRATAWLEKRGCKLNISVVHNSMISAAHHNPFNPLRDYLNSLEWDGVERLDVAMHHLLGADDNEYVRAVSRRFLVGSVARALDSGCKMDTMLILEGSQGLKKSTAVAELYGEDWFTDELGDLGSKDAAMQVQGRWCIEVAELATLSRAEANKAKEWITRRVDRFRPPYGRNIVEAPRQCVLIGTVNPEGGYLKDATGGRRFWPIACKKINIDWIKKRRDQIWAEAVVAFNNGERWWFDHDERHIAEVEQRERYESDPWTDPVVRYVNSGSTRLTSISEIMVSCLELPSSQQTQIAQTRIAKILVADGWSRTQRRISKDRRWVYVKEDE